MRNIVKQHGDTIVEVLLAMSVIGMVLGAAFGIANRSVAIGQNAQERTEALKHVETQIELLRAASGVDGNDLVDFSPDNALCFKSDTTIKDFGPVDINDLETGTGYPTECKFGPDGRYSISITKSEDYLFTVRARWIPLGSGPNQEITANYRVYPVGSVPSFPITPIGGGAPVLGASVTVSGVTATTATFSGEVVAVGGGTLAQKGFVYSTSPNPDFDTGTVVQTSGGGVGAFTDQAVSLTASTTYYVRSFARNSEGAISYSSIDVSFKTISAQKPTLGAPVALVTSPSSAKITATVNYNGSPAEAPQAVKLVRVIGSANADGGVATPPETYNDLLGGDISVNLTSLLPASTYRVYAYATNGLGTSKSSTTTFNTPAIPVSVPVTNPITYGGSDYYISNSEYTWSEAKNFTAISGGHLVTISTQAENDTVSSLAAGRRIWIGLNDVAIEGTWVWENGESVTYTNWSTNEPNDYLNGSPGEDVAVMNWSGGKWNDWFDNATAKAYFVIEYKK